MIVANTPWTLEGPYDSIEFHHELDGTPFILDEKPMTSVDDRRDIYPYPRAPGAHVGDAQPAHRVWTFKGKIVASSHTERNQSDQRLRDLLDSLQRHDGMLKWEPDGFPALQATVRRNGSVDPSGTRGMTGHFAFGLIGGDPNVYSQAEHSAALVVGALSTGTNLAAAVGNWTKLWTSGDALTAVGAGGFDGGAYQTITINGAYGIFAAPSTVDLPPIAKQVYVKLHMRQNHGGAKIVDLQPLFYDSVGRLITPDDPIEVSIPTGVWTAVSATVDVPDGAVSIGARAWATGWTSGKVLDLDGFVVALPQMTNSVTCDNAGKVDTPLRFEMALSSGAPTTFMVAGQPGFATDMSGFAGFTAVIDSSQPRRIYTPDGWLGSNLYGSRVDPTVPFPMLHPGQNKVGSTIAGTVYWRDAWRP